jgi:hypothetical protein
MWSALGGGDWQYYPVSCVFGIDMFIFLAKERRENV